MHLFRRQHFGLHSTDWASVFLDAFSALCPNERHFYCDLLTEPPFVKKEIGKFQKKLKGG
jgi:hypothetical protein